MRFPNVSISEFVIKIIGCTKASSVCFVCKASSRILKIRFQKHNGNEQRRKRPDLNMTEIWIAISVPETWRKLDRIAKSWYYRFPQNVNVTETWSSMFPSRLRNAETWVFVLCIMKDRLYIPYKAPYSALSKGTFLRLIFN